MICNSCDTKMEAKASSGFLGDCKIYQCPKCKKIEEYSPLSKLFGEINSCDL